MRAAVTAIGGRSGRVLSSDGALRLKLAPVSSAASGSTNPEQLLAAGCAASFLDALRDAALLRGEALGPHCNVTATVTATDDSSRLTVSLNVDLPGVADAGALVAAALALCPLAATLREPVAVTVTIA